MDLLMRAAGKPLFGLELVARSEGSLKRGTVYLTLDRLETRGFLESKRETAPVGPIPRNHFVVTGAGARVFRAWQIGQEAQRLALVDPSLQGI